MLGVLSAIKDVAAGSGPFNPKKIVIDVEGVGPIALPHLLNPTDLKIGRKVSWKCQPGTNPETAKGAPYQVFGGGGDTCSFSLLFDCSEEDGVSLGDELESLYDLTYPYTTHGTGKRAQIVVVKWEKFAFLGVVDSVDITVNLFDPTGAMKRATVGIAMQGQAFPKNTTIDAVKFFEKEREKDKKYKAGTGAAGGLAPGLASALGKFGI